MLNPAIFRKYDIRGIYGEQFTDADALILGKALGTYFRKKDLRFISVGADNRPSSPVIKENFINGLITTGMHVTDLGEVTTPMVLYSISSLMLNGGVIITASHNPVTHNGFKINYSNMPFTAYDYQQLKEIADSGSFADDTGNVVQEEIWPKYKQSITGVFKLNNSIKIGVDTNGGTCTKFADELYKELGVEISDNPDFYLSFDNDGDRLVVLNSNKEKITNDLIASVFVKNLTEKFGGCPVVFNVTVLRSVIAYSCKLDAAVSLSPTGYPFMLKTMDSTNALFGAEVSGHYFFRDRHLGYNDAFYAGARLLEIIDSKGNNLSKLIDETPMEYSTEEVRAKLPSGLDINMFYKDLCQQFNGAHILTLDGVRFTYPDLAWGIIRLSNTEDLVSVRSGAENMDRLAEMKKTIENSLYKHDIELDWSNPD